MVTFLIQFFLIVSAFFFVAGANPYGVQEAFIQYSAFAAIGLSFFLEKKREISNKWLGYIFLYLLANTVIFHFTPESRMTLVNILLGMLLIKTIAENIEFDFISIGIPFIVFAVFNALLLILQAKNIDPIYTSSNIAAMPQADTVGFMCAKFAMGVWASMAMPFVYSVSPYFCIFLLPMLLLSKSSIAVLTGISAFLMMAFFRNRKLFLWSACFLAACALGYVFLYDMPNGDFTKRLKIWWAAVSLLKTDYVFGHGLGTWKEAMVMTAQESSPELKYWSWMHNDILQFVYETGLIGALLVYYYFKTTISGLLRILSDKEVHVVITSFFVLIINSLFHFPFHLGRLAGISLFILAIVEAKLIDKGTTSCVKY